MLYQLSYASVAQTEQEYQTRPRNCKHLRARLSTSTAIGVENTCSVSTSVDETTHVFSIDYAKNSANPHVISLRPVQIFKFLSKPTLDLTYFPGFR